MRKPAAQELYAEAGKMVYKRATVQWKTRMRGATLREKSIGALRRTLTAESSFVTYFRAGGEAKSDPAAHNNASEERRRSRTLAPP